MDNEARAKRLVSKIWDRATGGIPSDFDVVRSDDDIKQALDEANKIGAAEVRMLSPNKWIKEGMERAAEIANVFALLYPKVRTAALDIKDEIRKAVEKL